MYKKQTKTRTISLYIRTADANVHITGHLTYGHTLLLQLPESPEFKGDIYRPSDEQEGGTLEPKGWICGWAGQTHHFL